MSVVHRMAEECDDQLRAHGSIEMHGAVAAAVAPGNATSAALAGHAVRAKLGDQDIVYKFSNRSTKS